MFAAAELLLEDLRENPQEMENYFSVSPAHALPLSVSRSGFTVKRAHTNLREREGEGKRDKRTSHLNSPFLHPHNKQTQGTFRPCVNINVPGTQIERARERQTKR